MSREMKVRKCGCIYYEVGPPVQCEKHQAKDKVREERGLRKIVAQQARDKGHDLTEFKEYGSTVGKWTAFCHTCGGLCIVYDEVPERGDQVAGKGIFEACPGGSGTFAALAGETPELPFGGDSDHSDEASE